MKQQHRYTKEDYQRIHDLVYEYKEGNAEAGAKILNSFSAFLNRYVSLLHYGYFDLKHSSIRNFIKLYIESPIKRSAVTSYKHNKGAGRLAAQETVDMIKPYFYSLTKEDISQEISTVFLTMASKYKDTKPSFQHHIDKNFHFYAFRHFERMTRDPLSRGECFDFVVNRQTHSLDSAFEIDLANAIRDYKFDKEMEDIEEDIAINQTIRQATISYLTTLDCTANENVSRYEDDFLDLNWINGITCTELFKVLTPFERRILTMWYIDKKTDTDIADMFGVCRGTINNKRAKAKQKLEDELKRLNLTVK